MKKILTSAIVIIACIATFSFTNKQPGFSKEALNEKLLSANDAQVSFQEVLSKHQGKILVIECWASWCGDCVKAMPKMKALQTDNPNVDYVFISMDKTADKWKAGIERHELKGDHYMANDGMKGVFGTAINLDWIPRYIIVDKKGKIVVYRAIETDFDKIKSTLKSLK
ncbi:TlpA disulfide reductase family protein [Flavobacterium sp.]|uniref:TlpA family protein disulfide reductase n=1 Tax=Flavobacterium sp. TaxID=239 RepID=UPI00286C7867|nr:TlpA disulfide reductase family protein [Flavobacterium sp.]